MQALLQLLCLICFPFAAVYVKLFYFKSKKEKVLLKIPGPKYHPLFGNTFDFATKREDRFNKLCQTINEFSESTLVRVWISGKPWIFVTKASAAEELLSSHRYLDKGYRYEYAVPWLGYGLLLSNGSKWKSRRRLLTPAFHFGILEKFLISMNKHAVEMVNSLKVQSVTNEEFDFYPFVSRCTLDIICDTAMGQTVNAQKLGGRTTLSEGIVYRSHRPWFRSNFIFGLTKKGKQWKKALKTVHGFSKSVIEKRKREYLDVNKSKNESSVKNDNDHGIKQRLVFLDLLIESYLKGEIDDTGIQEEVDTFMFEGHDTTSSAFSWFIYNVGRMPAIQEKIHDELDRVLGQSPVASISSSQLHTMKFTECVLKESMRMFPPVPMYFRETIEDIKISGYDIPVGSTLILFLNSIHNDEEHYKEPRTFNPERFLSENDSGRHPFSFVPFSAGPRNCIGQRFAMMELKTLIAHVLHRFRVVSTYDGPESLRVVSELVLRPLHGHYVKLENRH
ncbi:hypothetical protein CHUAL_009818 [Chamberlinius hualienensis]